jgi:hypothetical protein
VLDVKRQALAEVRQAELALFRRCADEGEAILLQAQPAPLVYRAVKLNVRAARWPRALEVAQAHRSHVDTVLALRARHLASLGGRAEWLPQFAAAAAAAGPLVSGSGGGGARASARARARSRSAAHALTAPPQLLRLARPRSACAGLARHQAPQPRAQAGRGVGRRAGAAAAGGRRCRRRAVAAARPCARCRRWQGRRRDGGLPWMTRGEPLL